MALRSLSQLKGFEIAMEPKIVIHEVTIVVVLIIIRVTMPIGTGICATEKSTDRASQP